MSVDALTRGMNLAAGSTGFDTSARLAGTLAGPVGMGRHGEPGQAQSTNT